MLRSIVAFVLLTAVLTAQQLHPSGASIRAHVKYLASDELEGRGVGTKGEKLATNYLAAQLQSEGLQPAGDNGTYFQNVPLVGETTEPSATLTVQSKPSPLTFHFVKDFVGAPFSQTANNNFDAEAVFVGHGISAPEYDWDDYKGQDLTGKVLIYFTNEPTSDDPKFFAGPALTYYGRWTYKFEEATRRGAVAALIIHTTSTAGYGWGVVSGSFSQEHPELRLRPGQKGLNFAGWLSEAAGAQLVASTGKSLPDLLDLVNQKDFRPIPLGIHIKGTIPSKMRLIDSRNVVARVAGSDPQLRSQAVLYSAHWDHLGIAVPVAGDNIYNGAVDNATGCAVLLELARIWAALPEKPKRSVFFLFVTAEESGLLGSEYYGEHPEVPVGQTAVDINFDALYPFGQTRDVSLTGAERTTAWPLIQREAKRFDLQITPDPEPGQGHYYRSDHFSLARFGVPAFSISPGTNYAGKPADYGKSIFETYNTQHYHQPSDEYHDNWDVTGMQQMASFGLALGLDFANAPKLYTWKPGDEFLAARTRSGVQ